MIELNDVQGRRIFFAPSAIVDISEAGSSMQWRGIGACVRTCDGRTFEVRESAFEIVRILKSDRPGGRGGLKPETVTTPVMTTEDAVWKRRAERLDCELKAAAVDIDSQTVKSYLADFLLRFGGKYDGAGMWAVSLYISDIAQIMTAIFAPAFNDVRNERAAFEAWPLFETMDDAGRENAWRAWQARAALAGGRERNG